MRPWNLRSVVFLKIIGKCTVDEISVSQEQVVENDTADKIKKAVDNAVMTVEKRVHDAILTAMDNVTIPRVEIAVRSVTESAGQEPNSVVQNAGQRDFSGNREDTPLMWASNRLDSSFDQDRNDETRNVDSFEDGNFPASRLNYDRRAHTHHSNTKILAIEFPELSFQKCIMKLGKLLLFSGK